MTIQYGTCATLRHRDVPIPVAYGVVKTLWFWTWRLYWWLSWRDALTASWRAKMAVKIFFTVFCYSCQISMYPWRLVFSGLVIWTRLLLHAFSGRFLSLWLFCPYYIRGVFNEIFLQKEQICVEKEKFIEKMALLGWSSNSFFNFASRLLLPPENERTKTTSVHRTDLSIYN